MASLKAFPDVNFGVFLALIVIVSPVLGFLPLRAFLFAAEKVPKPTSVAKASLLQALVFYLILDYYLFLLYLG